MKDEILFQGAGMNSDDDIRFFPKGDATTEGRLNCNVYEEGDYGLITNLKGNTKVNFTFPVSSQGSWKVIGAAPDIENNRIIYLVKNINGGVFPYDRILAKNIGSNTITDLTNQIHTDPISFNWTDDIDSRMNVKVVDNQLIWTDNTSAPSKLNLNNLSEYGGVYSKDSHSLIKASVFSEIRAYVINDDDSFDTFTSSNYYQFAFRLVFDEFEESVVSGYSNWVNTIEGRDRRIGVSFNYNILGNTIKYIDVLFKKNFSDNFSLAKRIGVTRSSTNTSLLTTSVGNFTTLANTLTVADGNKYIFYFNEQASFIGEIIDDRIADEVPLKSKTLEFADNRLMLANNLQGYDTPLLDGLTLTPISSVGHIYTSPITSSVTTETAPTDDTITVTINRTLSAWPSAFVNGDSSTSIYYEVDVSGDATYDKLIITIDKLQVYSDILNGNQTYFNDLIAANAKAVAILTTGATTELGLVPSSNNLVLTRTVDNGTTISATNVSNWWESSSTGMMFKSGSKYQIVGYFHDRYGRTAGAMVNGDYIESIPLRNVNNSSSITSYDQDLTIGFEWSFTGTTIGAIIPDWADTFSFGFSKCLDFSGVWQDAIAAFNDANYAVEIPEGYSFEEGDIVRDIEKSTTYNILKFQQSIDIAGTPDSRGWVIFSSGDYDKIKAADNIEFLRRKKIQDQQFFEISKKYKIDRSGTPYIIGDDGNNSGYFYGGDILANRNVLSETVNATTVTESFSALNGIKPNILGKSIPDLSQFNQQRYQNIYWSGKFFDNTRVNGLNSFLGTDNTDLNDEFGQINKIMIFGDTLKAYQDKKVTSILAGKTNIYNADGSNNVASFNRALSDSNNPSFQSYGVQFTHGITGNKNQRYFYDTLNGVIVRDSRNGLFPISGRLLASDVNMDYKMDKYFKNQSKTTIKTLVDDSELDNIHLTFDEENEMLYVFIKDTVDGAIKASIFHEPSNRWVTLSDMNNSSGRVPEYSICLNNEFITFLDGELWVQNTNETRCNFYGDQKDWICEAISNVPPNIIKTFNSINIHSNTSLLNNIIVPSSPSYSEMESDLLEAQFVLKENQYKSTYWKNKKTNQATATILDKFNGEDLRGYAIQNKLTKVDASSKIELFKVDVESLESVS